MSLVREPGEEPLPGYRLIEPLGSGGFGEAWKCEAPGGIFKAIKFVFGNLNSLDNDGVRADQELKALNRVKEIRHPFILSMDRIEIVDGELVIVMELADKSLHDAYQEALSAGLVGIPRDALLGYIRDSAEALDHMNEKHSLQHLDIKPRNLFLISNRVKVADFGLVKTLERTGLSGVLSGATPLYAPPETFTGQISCHSDQYSLAIVYQELLTGQRPFNGKKPAATRSDAHGRRAGPAQFAGGGTGRRRPRLVEGPGKALPELPRLRARFVQRPAVGEARRPRSRRPRAPRHPLRHDGGHPPRTGAERGRRRLLRFPGGEEVAVGRRRRGHRARVGAGHDDGSAADRVAAADGRHRHRRLGRRALIELRCRFLDRFGDLDKMPLFKFLYVDSDAEAVREARRGAPEVAFKDTEVYHLPLQPIAHYRRRQLDHLENGCRARSCSPCRAR